MFSIERNGEKEYMNNYFGENDLHVFNKHDSDDLIEKAFDKFIEMMKGEIENWSERGPGWVLEEIMGC